MLRRLLLACCLVGAACGAPDEATSSAQYLGQTRVAPGATLDGTVIGGLSGISYDPQSQLYYVISDDRSEENPARFYTVRISLSDTGIGDVEFVSTHALLDRDGKPFQALDADTSPPVIPPDPEGIAFDSARQRLYWSSEGERLTENVTRPALLDTSVRTAERDGGYLGEFEVPPVLQMSTGDSGPRQNHALEGLTLTPSGTHLWAAMEGPGYNDGEPPNNEHGALTRVTRFDVGTEKATAQYAYPLDPVSAGPGGDNGLTDLVALDDQNFLAVERGFGTHAVARIYRVGVGEAGDVLGRPALGTAPVKPMTKSLLVDLATTPGLSPLDNIEGITLGPKLPDGRQSVVLVSDDNFSQTQITQFLAFEM
jgi:hypothetical protein